MTSTCLSFTIDEVGNQNRVIGDGKHVDPPIGIKRNVDLI